MYPSYSKKWSNYVTLGMKHRYVILLSFYEVYLKGGESDRASS
jgi:hypothetical protein